MAKQNQRDPTPRGEAIFGDKRIKAQLSGVKVHFPIKKGLLRRVVGHVRAVDGVDFLIYSGETLGLVGESGCGKTTTGRALIRLVPVTAGDVFFRGKQGVVAHVNNLEADELRSIRTDMQIIFQDPYYSLNPRMRVGTIVTEPLNVNKVGNAESRRERGKMLLQLVGLDEYAMDRYPHEFSGGQRQRIGIARALALDPSFVVCDEPVSALDVSVQAQVVNLLRDIQQRFNLTMLFIAHDLSVVYNICDRIAVMYLGKIVEVASSDRIFRDPKHPYTEALMSAVPIPDPHVRADYITLPGNVPDAVQQIPGCPFHPRCRYKQDICTKEVPPLVAASEEEGNLVACHFSDRLDLRPVRVEEISLHERLAAKKERLTALRK